MPGLHCSGHVVGLPQRTCDGHDSRRADGELTFVLQVGNIGEVVDVEARGLLLETQSGVTGNVVSGATLVNMPLSGRNSATLGNLTAGVVASGTQFRASGARGVTSAGLV